MKTKCDSCDRSSREVGYLSTHNPGGKKSKVLHLCKDCRFDINVGIKLGFGGSARLPSSKKRMFAFDRFQSIGVRCKGCDRSVQRKSASWCSRVDCQNLKRRSR